MSDPVEEAVERARKKGGFTGESLPMYAAASEVLMPIRDLAERYVEFINRSPGRTKAGSVKSLLDELEPLIYTQL